MNSTDELRNLWHGGAELRPGKGEEEMLALVIEKTRSFDRRIAMRNLVEVVAGVSLFFFFGFLAWKAPNTLTRAGRAIIALSGIWIAYYILRFGAGPKLLDPGVELSRYRDLLRENYDQQIRLLRRVKYWYLLPLYTGIALGAVGEWMQWTTEGKPVRLASMLGMLVVTAIFAGIWVLNERYGVRHLERLKNELMAVSGEQ